MKSTRLKVEDIFGDVVSKDSIPPEQTTKPISFLGKRM